MISGIGRIRFAKPATTNWRRSSCKTIASSASDMRVALHILTHPDDTLAQQIVATHREQPDQEVHVVDLTAGSRIKRDYSRQSSPRIRLPSGESRFHYL